MQVWIRIRIHIPNTDPGPGRSWIRIQYVSGSGSTPLDCSDEQESKEWSYEDPDQSPLRPEERRVILSRLYEQGEDSFIGNFAAKVAGTLYAYNILISVPVPICFNVVDPDPNWIHIQDPDPYSNYGSGSRGENKMNKRQKM